MHVLSTYERILTSNSVIGQYHFNGSKNISVDVIPTLYVCSFTWITLKNENKPLSIESVRSPFLVLPSSGTQKV